MSTVPKLSTKEMTSSDSVILAFQAQVSVSVVLPQLLVVVY